MTDSNHVYIWQPAYLAAVFETDNSRMLVRIMDAHAAIEQRLLLPVEKDSEEYRELRAAQKALDVLESERVDNTGRSSE